MRTDERLKTIYETVIRIVVRNETAWKDYLSFAARIHKHSFDNALLVYAQNPNVTALASLQQWNKVGRNVNRGEKGIAVCEYKEAKLTLSYLFDISQTHGKELKMTDWQLDDEMKTKIAQKLITANGLTAVDFAETVAALASEKANEHYEDCLRWILANSQNHIFSELPKGGLEAQLISLITDSTAYIVGKRCGLADEEIILEGGMDTINDFNRISLIAPLGNTVTSCAKEILTEMEIIIKTINAERMPDNERQQYENQLHGKGRNTVPEPANIGRTDGRPTSRQIRKNGTGISERKSSEPLYSFENGWFANGGNAQGSADGNRENRAVNSGNAQNRPRTEHRGHAGTHTPFEQSEAVSRGNGNQGVHSDTEIKTDKPITAEPSLDGSALLSEETHTPSQFERVPISVARQIAQLDKQIREITCAIDRMKLEKGENWSVKQMVAFQKNLNDRLKRLSALEKKDDLLTFEQLGIDFMFVDEAHLFKNCFIYTKMSRVSGINTSSSQRAFDMLNKCQYLQEINNNRGVVFATGTPVSNSMTELFVMMRYLEPQELERQGLSDFDSWAATYGEIVSSLEITPEGGGYRMRQRFAKFHNLPELMRTYRLVADVQTAESLNLPRPDIYGGKKEVISAPATEYQKRKMATFVERAEAIRSGMVEPYEDNMLKLTGEARKMAIDPRLIDDNAPNDPNSKLNLCINQVYKIWKETEQERLTQLIFCDVSTPDGKTVIEKELIDGVYRVVPGQFTNAYDEIKKVLVDRGVPEDEIVFIHEAKTEAGRQDIFEKMRKGEIRILLGSTGKLGTGVNVQDRVIALHHLDVPWKPSDIIQRDGRGLRQGNMNSTIHIYHYVAEGTFDAYLWQIQEQKLRFITQISTAKNIARSCEDIDETVLTAAQFKAVATDNPKLLEKMELENRVSELRILQRNHQEEQLDLENKVNIYYPREIKDCIKVIGNSEGDLKLLNATDGQSFLMEINGKGFAERAKAGQMLMSIANQMTEKAFKIEIGKFRGFTMRLERTADWELDKIILVGAEEYACTLAESELGNIARIEHTADSVQFSLSRAKTKLENLQKQLEVAKGQLGKPFLFEDELVEKSAKLTELDTELELGKGDDTVIDESEDENGEDTEYSPVAVSVGEEV